MLLCFTERASIWRELISPIGNVPNQNMNYDEMLKYQLYYYQEYGEDPSLEEQHQFTRLIVNIWGKIARAAVNGDFEAFKDYDHDGLVDGESMEMVGWNDSSEWRERIEETEDDDDELETVSLSLSPNSPFDFDYEQDLNTTTTTITTTQQQTTEVPFPFPCLYAFSFSFSFSFSIIFQFNFS